MRLSYTAGLKFVVKTSRRAGLLIAGAYTSRWRRVYMKKMAKLTLNVDARDITAAKEFARR